MDPCLGIWGQKWDPCLPIFCQKPTHLGGTSPYSVSMEVPPRGERKEREEKGKKGRGDQERKMYYAYMGVKHPFRTVKRLLKTRKEGGGAEKS